MTSTQRPPSPQTQTELNPESENEKDFSVSLAKHSTPHENEVIAFDAKAITAPKIPRPEN